MPNLTFNLLTFKHPKETCTFYFSSEKDESMCRLYKTLVPNEVIEHFGEQDHYYTSFDEICFDGFEVSKPCIPERTTIVDDEEYDKSVFVRNSAFSASLLKRFYNSKLHQYFTDKNYLVKPNFVDDIEVWIPSIDKTSDNLYNYYDKFIIKLQIARITKEPEFLLSFEGTSKVFKQSVGDLSNKVAPENFNWVIYDNHISKFKHLPDTAKRDYNNIFPVRNFEIRKALNQTVSAPERGNKYLKYKSKIEHFFTEHICSDEFLKIIPVNCDTFISVEELKIRTVTSKSNQLKFGNEHKDISPITGMKEGPLEPCTATNIHFFFIYHKSQKNEALRIDNFFRGKEKGFSGLTKYIHTLYHTEQGFSIQYENKANPLPEIREAIKNKAFKSDVQYFAIYLSPFSKHTNDKSQREIYYKLKELLLDYKIPSQVLESSKILSNNNYHYSLPNIAIAILSKLNGVPWRLDTTLKSDLIVGVGAFKHIDTNVQYVGSAFSFQNNGRFNSFDCFRNNEIDELAGSILSTVKDYAAHRSDLSRLIIHFYKNMKQSELQPIEDGLKKLGLNIPVFIVAINKTESRDIIAFDDEWAQQMPLSGTYINIEFNRYLLFNNTRYNNYPPKGTAGYPFPVKLHIACTDKELERDHVVVKELIDQVYQFSRIYWKSLSQQNLPVTIKYPEMVAEMFPYFEGNEIPEFGKDNLWFL